MFLQQKCYIAEYKAMRFAVHRRNHGKVGNISQPVKSYINNTKI